jgi:hypothetical protein
MFFEHCTSIVGKVAPMKLLDRVLNPREIGGASA